MGRDVFLAGLFFCLCACTPSPAPPPPSGDMCRDACARREALGCIEPWAVPNCVPNCERAVRLRYDPLRIAVARDKDEMRAAGVRCDR